LNFDFYENYQTSSNDKFPNILKTLDVSSNRKNLKTLTIYDQTILIHSEQRSKNLKTYQRNQYITVYYWNHALLSLDWFRYAEHAILKKTPIKKFLIYNRAWTGTREYRLKFADLLIDHNLIDQCQMSVGFTDQNIYYKNYAFTNASWKPTNQLENYFDINNTTSTYSADFTLEDYANTDIEVVLETLFDDDRLHLTEKSLRPIACGQPFILAATHGSLKYLKSYGFQTFDSVIDESYDQIENPIKRLQAIIKLMQQINNWTKNERQIKMTKLQKIAEFNRQHFFGNAFSNQVMTELKNNLSTAFTEFKNTKKCTQWIDRWNKLLTHQSILDYLNTSTNLLYPTKKQVDIVYQEAIKYIDN
jgi:predicted adenine nucleotide alpha hydrolase (AANH) superfamily ATPase